MSALSKTNTDADPDKSEIKGALLELAGGRATISDHTTKSWASITFAGTRHRLTVRFEGQAGIEAGELFVAFLPEHEFGNLDGRGRMVADAAVVHVDFAAGEHLYADIELLVLEA